jgi:hypothetical protein
VSRRLGGWIATTLVAALTGCAASPPVQTVAPFPSNQIETVLYLIGDAGAPDTTREPVLEALRTELAASGDRSLVVFLGDNAYPRGLPAPAQPGRRAAELSLLAQVGAITSSGARGFFVPGNHDWAKHGPDGWGAIQRQAAFVDSAGGRAVSLRPHGGCPGPDVVDVGTRLRLILLDTQWWLHGGPKPQHPTSQCPTDTGEEIEGSLRAALAGASGRLVVVAAHHPLESGGEHGGYFTWRDHLFPLLPAVHWLWLPLPLIGSLYPSARQQGISSQDVPSRPYQQMIKTFARAFADNPPSVYASGHDHNLQVIRDEQRPLLLISGAGIYGHTTEVTRIRGTLFARDASGYARLDIPRSGPARLGIVQVDASGWGREVFSTLVD